MDEGRRKEIAARIRKLSVFDYPPTDLCQSQLYADVFRDRNRYSQTAREWMYYDGSRWILDEGGLEARAAAKALCRELCSYAPEASKNEQELKVNMQIASKWTISGYRSNVVCDARDENYITADELDRDDYLLNVENGTLRLCPDGSVKFLKHDPEMLLSKIANVTYNPGATCERWEKFLSEIMEENAEKILYLQKIAGLCVSGNTQNEKMWFFHGQSTRNGKSTYLETLKYLLGDYSESIRPDTLAAKSPDSRSPSPDIAKLKGIRLAVFSEPEKHMQLDVALLKSLTGGDTLTARFLHQNEISFRPKFKLICNCNFLPAVNDQTIFQSDRVSIVSFDRHFSENERDTNLKNFFRQPENLSGILNWMLEGWRLFCAEGLKDPQPVKLATKQYSENSDKIFQFFQDCLERSDKDNISVKDAYTTYERWCRDNGYLVENRRNFQTELKNRNLYKERGMCGGRQCRHIVPGFTTNFQQTENNPFSE